MMNQEIKNNLQDSVKKIKSLLVVETSQMGELNKFHIFDAHNDSEGLKMLFFTLEFNINSGIEFTDVVDSLKNTEKLLIKLFNRFSIDKNGKVKSINEENLKYAGSIVGQINYNIEEESIKLSIDISFN